MAKVGEFCTANVARLLLGVFILLVLLLSIGVWFFYSPGRSTSIEKSKQAAPAASH